MLPRLCAPTPMLQERINALLRCPACGGNLDAAIKAVVCATCKATYPVIDGVTRFVGDPENDLARRTQKSFGYEWSAFNDWQISGVTNFNQYFGDLDLDSLHRLEVLDAGCGMGRHARQ